ncbi:MAG: hypothetical protein B7X34_08870 [Acidobacteriia bacterium 12-62-4]|nr:MAG: hypothetical protein B7X34_08870 [Acidobacteriia bacterium 12-62-4]
MAIAELVAPSEAQSVDRIKRNFLASLNHELRTPLTGILGMLDLLTETPLSEEQKDYVSSSRSCAELLLESITNAIEYSSLTNGTSGHTYSDFRPAEMLQAAVAAREPKARSKGLHLSLLLDPQLPELALSDPHRVRQILDVLLSNAIKFTAEVANPLADPSPGLRVGLPLAKQITEAMGGALQVESYPGQGSLFTFTIPISAAAAEPPAPLLIEPVEPAGARILLVEDNSVAQRFMTTLLERRGYTVTLAPDGLAALEHAALQHFDLILMDLQMPGIDGIETTRRLRQTDAAATVPIIACTANPSSEVRAECTAAGMNDFLSKPVNSAELFTVLERHGGLRRGAAANH